MSERPDEQPNPSVAVRQVLADGTVTFDTPGTHTVLVMALDADYSMDERIAPTLAR